MRGGAFNKSLKNRARNNAKPLTVALDSAIAKTTICQAGFVDTMFRAAQRPQARPVVANGLARCGDLAGE